MFSFLTGPSSGCFCFLSISLNAERLFGALCFPPLLSGLHPVWYKGTLPAPTSPFCRISKEEKELSISSSTTEQQLLPALTAESPPPLPPFPSSRRATAPSTLTKGPTTAHTDPSQGPSTSGPPQHRGEPASPAHPQIKPWPYLQLQQPSPMHRCRVRVLGADYAPLGAF